MSESLSFLNDITRLTGLVRLDGTFSNIYLNAKSRATHCDSDMDDQRHPACSVTCTAVQLVHNITLNECA